MSRETTDFNSTKYAAPQPIQDSGLVRIDLALQLIGSGKRVLDLGCWDGSIAQRIKEQGNEVYGFENSRPAAEMARQKGIEVVECNIEGDWPTFDFQFDAIWGGEIIEHVFDTDAFLQKIRSLLKDGGQVILSTPNIATLGRRLMLMLGKNPMTEYTAREHDAGHIRYFTHQDMRQLLEDNRFEVSDLISDVLNFNGTGTLYSRLIPKLFPTLGRSVIVRALKQP
ncbi:MAG: class I SAM-dependent methyltransferase [bacterium]|nr:class I SAM-dependent methyltransferase [bacterium]